MNRLDFNILISNLFIIASLVSDKNQIVLIIIGTTWAALAVVQCTLIERRR